MRNNNKLGVGRKVFQHLGIFSNADGVFAVTRGQLYTCLVDTSIDGYVSLSKMESLMVWNN